MVVENVERILELYCFKKETKDKGKTEVEYHTSVKAGHGEVLHSLEDVARYANDVFFGDGKCGYVYDKVILYSSQDTNFDGKPKIIVTRESTELIGDASSEFTKLYSFMEQNRIKKSTETPLEEKPVIQFSNI